MCPTHRLGTFSRWKGPSFRPRLAAPRLRTTGGGGQTAPDGTRGTGPTFQSQQQN
ncbi:hypothetical protein BDP81DRAFT_415170 [Colletotrichum phormii]|uniref:Uncharacterized protein n=1 Tax=Colletotrichum phormii TaxID=359342 RepID=A0AAJ0A3Z7_9PEZI|nr:uncharacterized protein BDP81DRAFT_415170 [Colletotrichum phormii]KAK1654190.1 hypothetical protein BDP81DRAFT_415170 [Colletotrichum phormii]